MQNDIEAGDTERGHGKLSRQTVEELCLLGAVGRSPCDPDELTSRLGLSPWLKGAVETASKRLENQGLLLSSEGRILPTESGLSRLAQFAEVQA